MATVGLSIALETDILGDAIEELTAIRKRLARCHGSPFRALDRRIDALFDDDDVQATEVHWLNGGILIAAPSAEMTAIIVEARRLGVLDAHGE